MLLITGQQTDRHLQPVIHLAPQDELVEMKVLFLIQIKAWEKSKISNHKLQITDFEYQINDNLKYKKIAKARFGIDVENFF